MTSSHLADNLAVLARETAALNHSIAGLDDAAMRGDTLCRGWTRAHVVTHLARNADALGNLLHWASTGERREAYASPEARDAAIEAGAQRGAEELRADHEHAAAAFAQAAAALHGPAGEAEVVTRAGTTVRGAQVPSMRLIEVVFHHVDLQVGYTFADTDPGFVARTLRQGARRWQAAAQAGEGAGAGADLTLVTAEGDEHVIGAGGQRVGGTAADLLLWLARGVEHDLEHDGPLPGPPPWA